MIEELISQKLYCKKGTEDLTQVKLFIIISLQLDTEIDRQLCPCM